MRRHIEPQLATASPSEATAAAERQRRKRDQAHGVAVALIGRGLDLQPGNPWEMAHDVAQALGLIPTVTAGPTRDTITRARRPHRRNPDAIRDEHGRQARAADGRYVR